MPPGRMTVAVCMPALWQYMHAARAPLRPLSFRRLCMHDGLGLCMHGGRGRSMAGGAVWRERRLYGGRGLVCRESPLYAHACRVSCVDRGSFLSLSIAAYRESSPLPWREVASSSLERGSFLLPEAYPGIMRERKLPPGIERERKLPLPWREEASSSL